MKKNEIWMLTDLLIWIISGCIQTRQDEDQQECKVPSIYNLYTLDLVCLRREG